MMLKEIVKETKALLSNIRGLARLVETYQFQQCLILDPNNPVLFAAIKAGDYKVVKKWLSEVIEAEICELSVRQLRAIAAQMCIAYYTAYSKDELLVKIVQVKSNVILDETEKLAVRVPLDANAIEALLG